MNWRHVLIGFLLSCGACTNIEDAKPAERNTFVRFYEASHNQYGIAAEPVDGGYIILANELLRNGDLNSLLIRTDAKGERIADDILLPNGTSKALKVGPDGYYVIGDSIKLNPGSESLADLIVTSARLFKIGLTGNIVKKVVIADRKDTINFTDIHGSAVTLNTTGNLIVLGTYKDVGIATTEKPFLASLNPTTFDTLWAKQYDIIDRDYVNSKSVQATSTGDVIWTSALLKSNQNFSRSYLSVPYVKENSVFVNFDLYGETSDQQIYPNDIQPAESVVFGYGVVGTFSAPNGTDANLFFMRVDQNGNIISDSEKYFDGELSANNQPVNEGESASEDTGNAITSTSDGGFVLAGSMLTTPNRGNGGKDIFLIKVDSQGNMLWNKIIGGEGDETVNTIRETDDGGLLICGSNDVSGLSSIFIMKTDSNGELKD